MKVRVLYFAIAREKAGQREEEIQLEGPLTVAAIREVLAERHPGLAPLLPRLRLAIDEAFAPDDAPVPEGAVVAVIPPVSGG